MNKTLLKLVITGFLVLSVNTAFAELFVNPIKKNRAGATQSSFHFGTSEVEYEIGNNTFDIERTFIGATLTYGSSNKMDFFGTISYSMEVEVENSTQDDTGFILGGGFRTNFAKKQDFDLHAYGQFLLIDEEYGGSSEGEETAMMLGLAASTQLAQDFVGYGGVELNLYSDMDINGADADRDDFLGFRIGANYDAESFLLNFNLSMMHENGFFIGASMPF